MHMRAFSHRLPLRTSLARNPVHPCRKMVSRNPSIFLLHPTRPPSSSILSMCSTSMMTTLHTLPQASCTSSVCIAARTVHSCLRKQYQCTRSKPLRLKSLRSWRANSTTSCRRRSTSSPDSVVNIMHEWLNYGKLDHYTWWICMMNQYHFLVWLIR